MHHIIEKYEEANNFGRHFGMKLKVVRKGEVQYSMKVGEELQAVPGTAHGGVLAGLIDGSLGVAGLSQVAHNNQVVSTVEFKVNYLKPTKIGDEICCIAKVIHEGKSLIYIQAEVVNHKNELLATGNGTFNKYKCPDSLSVK